MKTNWELSNSDKDSHNDIVNLLIGLPFIGILMCCTAIMIGTFVIIVLMMLIAIGYLLGVLL